jgi:trimeric autotransporter adhesin
VFSTTLGGAPQLRIPLVPGVSNFGPNGTASPLGPVSGTSFLSPDGTFFYANLTPVNSPTEREFVAGGLPVSANAPGAIGPNRVVAFTVQPDAALQSNIPFIRNPAPGNNFANAYVSPLFIAPQTSAALQSSLAINGNGANQKSVLVTAIGNSATLQSSGAPMLNGVVRGSSQSSALAPSIRIGSNFASVVDGNGNSLYGGTAITGFVLDQTKYNSTGPFSNVLTTPVVPSTASEVALSGATTNYGFNQPATATNLPAGAGTNHTSQSLLTGNFGGLMNTNARAKPYAVTGIAALSTNADANRVAAVLASDPLKSHKTGGVNNIAMVFGPQNSAFIDNNIYGAAESQIVPATINGKPAQSAQLYFLSSGAAPPPNSLLPANTSYCQCQYLQWGYWGGDITSANASGSYTPRIDRGNINFWTAGPATPLADINKLAAQGAVGNYTGHMIGSVFNNGAQYTAAGGVAATYNFGTRTGSFSVINYDNGLINFTTQGKPTTSGASYKFGITGVPGIKGMINGSFYGPMAAETGGNFKFQTTAGPTYLTSGIFAAKR